MLFYNQTNTRNFKTMMIFGQEIFKEDSYSFSFKTFPFEIGVA
jgi:hypothetical protein